MLNTFRLKSTCEEDAKFVQDHILSVERRTAEFSNAFGQYSKKAERLRDQSDEISKILQDYAKSETINKSLSKHFNNFSEILSVLSTYGDLRIYYIDDKIVKEFEKYENICKIAKDEVKQIYNVREKEMTKKRQLDRIKDRNPRNRQMIIEAETELVKATAEVSKSIHNLEDKITSFERQKLHDMKSIFLDFVCIEIGYHSKTLEILTQAFNCINQINEDSDLEEFKKSLRTPETTQYSSTRNLFRPSNSFGSLGNLFSKKPQGIKTFKSEEKLNVSKQSTETTEDSDSDSSITDDTTTTNENLK